jgi:putative oxidoreductase
MHYTVCTRFIPYYLFKYTIMFTQIQKCETYLEPAGRIIIGAFFLLAGLSKFADLSGTAGYIDSVGIPMASTVAILTAVFETAAGLALVIGKYTKHAAVLLAGFTLLATALFHAPATWAEAPMQQIMFMKNIAIVGGLLYMAGHLTSTKHVPAAKEDTRTDSETL